MKEPFHAGRGMTLAEVMVAMLIFGLVSAGIVASLTQSRRLTEGSVAQASAQAAVESYMEQMENMDLSLLLNYDANKNPQWTANYAIPTLKDETLQGADTLVWSNNGFGNPTIPKLSDFEPGNTPTTPAGIVDNFKEVAYDPNNTGMSETSWDAIWPHHAKNPNIVIDPATSQPALPHSNCLHLNIWVWVTDLSDPSATADANHPNAYAKQVYGITIIYTWQFWNGITTIYYSGILHTVRSIIS